MGFRVGNQELSGAASKVKYTSLWDSGAGMLEFKYPASMARNLFRGGDGCLHLLRKSGFYGFLF